MGEPKQSIWEHLADLRKRLIWSILGLAVTCGVGISFTNPVFRYLISELNVLLVKFNGTDLITVGQIGLVQLFLVQFNTGIKLGIAVGIPWVLYQLALFIIPALTPAEKKWLYIGLPAAFILFLIGSAFAYIFVVPATMRFFIFITHQTGVPVIFTLNNWIELILNLVIPFGLVFEMPLLVGILARLGILRADMLTRFRKYAILIIFIVAAIISPPTVVDQIFLAIPMMILYEISILIARWIGRKPKAPRE